MMDGEIHMLDFSRLVDSMQTIGVVWTAMLPNLKRLVVHYQGVMDKGVVSEIDRNMARDLLAKIKFKE
jgi:hypothetical protein